MVRVLAGRKRCGSDECHHILRHAVTDMAYFAALDTSPACRAWNDLRRLVQVSTIQDINFGESIVFYPGWVWGPLAPEHLSSDVWT